ncbi:MAG: hypothetical protein ACU0B7_10610 [Paracoccaceae bacterium]
MQNTDIDPTDFEADAAIIAQRLAATLSRIRKRKLASELIGSDERSNEFKVADFDRFADELSAGVDITRYDRKRIERRALGLALRRADQSTSCAIDTSQFGF